MMDIIQELKELTELYDITAAKDDSYEQELRNAEAELAAAAPREYEDWVYWQKQVNDYNEITQKTLDKLAIEIKELAVQLGRTYKSRLFSWVYNKGRESWKTEMVRGFLMAYHADASQFIEVGKPSITCRKNKVDKDE